MTDLQMLGNSFGGFGLVSTYQRLVPLFHPKVHLFGISLLKILARAALAIEDSSFLGLYIF